MTCEIVSFYAETTIKDRVTDCLYLEAKAEQWSDEAANIHKIPYAHNQLQQCQDDAFLKIMSYLNGKGGKIVCHANYKNQLGNYYYDIAVLKGTAFKLNMYYDFQKLLRDFKVESTHTLAKRYLELPGYSLDKVAAYYNINLNHHDVKDDVRATRIIYNKLVKNKLHDEFEEEKQLSFITDSEKSSS